MDRLRYSDMVVTMETWSHPQILELDPKTFFQTHYDLMQIFASLINNKKNLKNPIAAPGSISIRLPRLKMLT